MIKLWRKYILLSGILWLFLVSNIAQGTDWFDDVNWYWSGIKNAVSWISAIWTTWTDENNWDEILNTAQRTINRILWMLSFVALVLCLRGWFQMLTAAWDDWKVKSWTKVLKHAAIWLAVIGLSWLIVSFIFWIVGKSTASS